MVSGIHTFRDYDGYGSSKQMFYANNSPARRGCCTSTDEADMREVSHFLLELKNGSESRGDGICEIPHAAPANEIGAGSDVNPHPSSTPLSLDPLQSASPETKVSYAEVR